MAGPEHGEAPDDLPLDFVGHADRGRLGDGGVADQDRLDLGRPEPLAGDLDRVVAAAVEEPVAVVVDRGPVAVDPDVRPARPVGAQVARRGRSRCPASSPARAWCRPARRPRLASGLPVGVEDVDGHPQRRPDQRAGLQRRDREGREEAGADLRPAREVDDRAAAAADVLESTSARARGSRARPSSARIRRRDRSCAGTGSSPCLHQRADQGRRDAQDRDPVPLDHRPEPVGAGIVGRPLDRTTVPPGARPPTISQGPMIQPRSVTQNSRSSAVMSTWWRDLLRDLDQEPAVDVDRPLGPARSCPTCRRS